MLDELVDEEDRDTSAAGPFTHPNTECRVTGLSPIKGLRYHLIGKDYDLCEAAFDALSDPVGDRTIIVFFLSDTHHPRVARVLTFRPQPGLLSVVHIAHVVQTGGWNPFVKHEQLHTHATNITTALSS
jgi:hypothetical protein